MLFFEETERQNRLLTEGVSSQSVNDAINNLYNVNILYRDFHDNKPPSKRYIQVYNYAKNKGNKTE